MKKSKARQEYERVRRNLLQQRNRAEKRGSKYWFDLDMTPEQEAKIRGKKKATAAEYRKATAGLKAVKKMFSEKWKREKEAREEPPVDASQRAIDQWIKNNFEPLTEDKRGAQYIVNKVTELVARYKPNRVAKAINDLKAIGRVIGHAEVYKVGYAMRYIADMQSYLLGNGIMQPDEMIQAEDAMFDLYGEDVEEELQ